MKFKLWKQAIAITAFTVSGVTGCSTAAFAYDVDNYDLDMAYTQTHRGKLCTNFVDLIRSESYNSTDSRAYYVAYDSAQLNKVLTSKIYDRVVDTIPVPVSASNDVRVAISMFVTLEGAVAHGASRDDMITSCASALASPSMRTVNFAAALSIFNEIDDE